MPALTSPILSLWSLAGLILAVLDMHGISHGRIFAEVWDHPRLGLDQTSGTQTWPWSAGSTRLALCTLWRHGSCFLNRSARPFELQNKCNKSKVVFTWL